MATYQLTNKAESDIEKIYEYSILNFGLRIAGEYILGLHDCFELLAEYQSWGAIIVLLHQDYSVMNIAPTPSIISPVKKEF